jgi:hypothetical protein
VPTTAMPPPAGQRYPQMRRHLPDGHRPPRRRRDRRCQPRDIPATEVARRNYHRILSMAGPADKAAAAVLTVLLDAAGDYLNDVTMSQEQIGDRLRQRHPGAPLWGTGTSTVRRGTRILEDLGFVSVQDVPIPGRDGLHTLMVRFHVPDHAQTAWDRLAGNVERKRAKRAAEARAKRAERDRQNRVAPPAGPATPPPIDARPALVEADTPDTRPDQACEEAAGVAAGLHRQGFPLADVLQVLARRWAPGTEPYRAGEQVARLNDQRVRNQRVRSGARAGP